MRWFAQLTSSPTIKNKRTPLNREIVFQPEPLTSNEPSLLTSARLGAILIDVSARFLKDAAFAKEVRAITDRHVVSLWTRMLTASATTLVAHGRESLEKNVPYVFMSNHLSLLDIPILFGAIPPSLRMVAKAELLRIPVFGKALQDAGFIIVDRKDRMKAIAQLEKAKEHLKNGVSVWIAPEGTRKRDTNVDLQPFKKGGFYTALSLEVPIVPMWIEGTDKVLSPNSHSIQPNQTVNVYFGTPISTMGTSTKDIPALMQRVRSEMLALRTLALTPQR
jgi:1-acyl-sn-glycerol-3-phosphate acyltransferase